MSELSIKHMNYFISLPFDKSENLDRHSSSRIPRALKNHLS